MPYLAHPPDLGCSIYSVNPACTYILSLLILCFQLPSSACMSSWLFFSPKQSQVSTKSTPRSPSQSLLHYEPGLTPPSARVNPKLKLQPRRPLRIWDYWKIAPILAAKGWFCYPLYSLLKCSMQLRRSPPMSSLITSGGHVARRGELK